MIFAGAKDRIREALQEGKRLLLCLDFDGTLAPLQDDPTTVTLPERASVVLSALAAEPKVVIAVISGRALEDLMQRVKLPLIYVGNHGLEVSMPGLRYRDPEAARCAPHLREVTQLLDANLGHIQGVLVENKSVTASVHYRRAELAMHAETVDIVRETVAPASDVFELSFGNLVLEIRPKIGGTKGSIAKELFETLGPLETMPICIGDDTTDEHMFRALSNGITVRVGWEGPSSAAYRLRGCSEVIEFIAMILDVVQCLPVDRGSEISSEYSALLRSLLTATPGA